MDAAFLDTSPDIASWLKMRALGDIHHHHATIKHGYSSLQIKHGYSSLQIKHSYSSLQIKHGYSYLQIKHHYSSLHIKHSYLNHPRTA
jgi:hypothetical protein